METNTDRADQGMDLRGTLGLLRRRFWPIVICFIVVTGAALAYSLSRPTEYSTSASLLFRDPGFDQKLFGAPSFQAITDPAREAATNVDLVSLPVVAQETAEDIHSGLTGAQVASMMTIAPQGDSNVD